MVDYILPGVWTFILWTLPPRRTCSDLSSSGHVAATCRVGGMTLGPRIQLPWGHCTDNNRGGARQLYLKLPWGQCSWNSCSLVAGGWRTLSGTEVYWRVTFLFRGKWTICINCCLVNLSLHWWYIPSECFWLFPGSFSSTQLQRTDSLPTMAAKIFIAVNVVMTMIIIQHDIENNICWRLWFSENLVVSPSLSHLACVWTMLVSDLSNKIWGRNQWIPVWTS